MTSTSAWVRRVGPGASREPEPDRVAAMQAILPKVLVAWVAGLLVAYALAARRFVR